MADISKKDWKLFREKLGDWQEAYMGRLVEEYMALLSTDELASDRFWALEKRIRQDKKSPGVLISPRRSQAVWDIFRFVNDGVIGLEDLEDFSEDLQDTVRHILQMYENRN